MQGGYRDEKSWYPPFDFKESSGGLCCISGV